MVKFQGPSIVYAHKHLECLSIYLGISVPGDCLQDYRQVRVYQNQYQYPQKRREKNASSFLLLKPNGFPFWTPKKMVDTPSQWLQVDD